MRTDMRVKFKIDGSAWCACRRSCLHTDGAHSMVTGQVDFGATGPR